MSQAEAMETSPKSDVSIHSNSAESTGLDNEPGQPDPCSPSISSADESGSAPAEGSDLVKDQENNQGITSTAEESTGLDNESGQPDPCSPSISSADESESAPAEGSDLVEDQENNQGITSTAEESKTEDSGDRSRSGQPVNKFAQLGLTDQLVASIDEAGYTTPTPIQSKTIPLILAGKDVLGQAQTGTGKTAAFALPLLDRVDLHNKRTQVLVLVPTRELAIQVAESFESYAKYLKGLRVAAIYGGQDYHVQFKQLNRGAHVVVGTPGRVMDHLRRKTMNLEGLVCLVLDEADEMLRMGFAEDVDWVLTQAPKQRQMAFFSATLPNQIRAIASKHLHDPAQITIDKKRTTASTINQRYVIASPHQKQAALSRILEAEPTEGVLIFVKMRSTTEPLADFVATETGLTTAALNGDVPQKQREKIVENLRRGKIDVIVATDVAARGLDVERISHVVNYDLPHDVESYVHRIGRTGRAGRNGEAILFLHPREKTVLNEIEKGTRQSIERYAVPNNRAINKSRVTRFHEKISESLGSREIEKFRTIIEHYENENDVPMENIAAALAVMANGQTSMLVREELKLPDFSEHNSRESVRGRKGGHGQQRHGGRKSESSAARRFARSNSQFESYRIEIGNQDRVQPGNIVGAITNEAGIGNEAIGKIKIFDRYSTVDLPLDISQSAIDHLKGVTVSGRSLNISKLTESDRHSSDRHSSDRNSRDRNSRDRNSRDRRPASRMGNKKNDQQKRSSFPKSDNLSNQRNKGRDFKHRGEGTAESGVAPAKEKGFNPKTSEQKNKFQKSTGSPKKKNFSKPGSFGAKKKFSTKKKSGKPQSSQSSFSPSSRKKNK